VAFADRLTRTPAAIQPADVAALRGHGWSDAAIAHAVQVIALFAYYNRIADGLGIHSHDDPP
jgi:alkylhydroperoxidase family enzyme